jgi:hypothetical protein
MRKSESVLDFEQSNSNSKTQAEESQSSINKIRFAREAEIETNKDFTIKILHFTSQSFQFLHKKSFSQPAASLNFDQVQIEQSVTTL